MSESKHTPGPWRIRVVSKFHVDDEHTTIEAIEVWGGDELVVSDVLDHSTANLIAAAPDMLEALRLHKAWSDGEDAGPDYGGQTRDTHPDGERIWRRWWNDQLDLCERASRATDAAISKAEGRS